MLTQSIEVGPGAVVSRERKSRFMMGGRMLSDRTEEQHGAPVAPRVGGDLRAARERLGWSIPDIAAGLRIRGQYLVALEDGRIDALPGAAYAVGFLRTYATTLGLDPDELTRRFRNEAEDVNRKIELVFPAPVPERGVPAGAVVLLGVVLAIGAYIGWYRLSGDGELPPEVVAPVPARLAPLAEQAVPPSLVNAANPAAPAPQAPPAATSASAAPATPASPSVAPMPSQVDLASIPEPVASVPPSQAAAATMPPVAMLPPQPAPDQPRIVLSANADSWLLVRDKSGQVLLNRVLHAGETWPVPLLPNLILTTGNAGGTNILVDGAEAPSLGTAGAVRRDIPLDPDLLKSGKLGSLAVPVMTASMSPPVAQRPTAQ